MWTCELIISFNETYLSNVWGSCSTWNGSNTKLTNTPVSMNDNTSSYPFQHLLMEYGQ